MTQPKSPPTTRERVLLASGAAAVFVLMLIVGFYHVLHGDEAMWAYQAALVRDGRLPSYDFFTQEPWALFAPVAAAYHVFGESIEAIRLVQTVCAFAANAMVVATVWRWRGRVAAAAAFSLLLFNVDYMSTMQTYNSQGFSIFALVAAWYFLVFPRHTTWGHYALSGLFLGAAIASRIPVALASLAVAGHALCDSGEDQWRMRRALGKLTAAALAAAAMCLPDAWIYSLDFHRVFFARVVSVNDLFRLGRHDESGSLFSPDLGARLVAWRDYFLMPSYHAVLQNMVFPLAVAVTLAAHGLVRRRLGRPSPDLAWTIAFAIAVVTGYSLSWILLPGYYTAAYPFLVVITVAAGQATLRNVAATPAAAKVIKAAMIAVLVGHAAQGIGHGLQQVILRHTPSLGEPLTIVRLGCWLERATAPEDRILDFHPINAVAARRYLPDGFEASVQLKHWYSLPAADQPQVRAISLPKLRALVTEGTVPVVIDNDVATSLYYHFWPTFPDDVARNYVNVGSIGQPVAPESVWVERRWLAARGGVLPTFPTDEPTTTTLALLRTKGREALFHALVTDTKASLRTLPRDVTASVARLADASWPARCGDYVSGNIEPVK